MKKNRFARGVPLYPHILVVIVIVINNSFILRPPNFFGICYYLQEFLWRGWFSRASLPVPPSHSTNQPDAACVHVFFWVVASQWGILQLAPTPRNEWRVGSCLTSCDPVAFRMILTHLWPWAAIRCTLTNEVTVPKELVSCSWVEQ